MADRVYRSRPAKPKQPPRPRRDRPVDTSKPGVSASDRRAAGDRTGMRNTSKRAERRGGAELEISTTGKPSRKSTRKSANHIKRTTNQQLQAERATSSPKARAQRGKVRDQRTSARRG